MLLGLVSACSGSRPAPESEALEVEYGGCDSIEADDEPTCTLATDELRLWVEDPEAERAQVWLDDERVEPIPYRHEELLGLGLRLEVPAGATRVRVTVERAPGRVAGWSLRLSHDEPPPAVRDARGAIVSAANDGELAEAIEQLDALQRDAPASTDTLEAALAVAHHLIQTANDPERAEALLDEVAPMAARTPYGRAQLANSRGLLAWKRRRLDEAAIAYREAARHALRVRDEAIELNALMMYSELLAELGYLGAAVHWARHVRDLLDAPGAAPGDIASASRTLGWIALQLRAAGRDELDPELPYREALALLGPGGGAESPDRVGGARLGLARVALEDGDPSEALRELERIDPTRLRPDEHALALDLEIRARLERGDDPAAVEPRLDALEQTAAELDTPPLRWQLAVLRGRVAERRGDVEAAIEHYRHAEERYDEASADAMFGAGRSTIGAHGPEATRRLLDLLVREGRLAEAMCTARLARARALRPLVLPRSLDPEQRRALQEQVRRYAHRESEIDELEASGQALAGRDRLRRQREARARRDALIPESNALFLERGRLAARPTCEGLTARAPGELLLAIHPLDDRWLVLAQDDTGIVTHEVTMAGSLSSRSPEEQSRRLLEPLREALTRARRIRVSAVGEAIDVDVHALPLDGAPLLAHAAVGYAVELPAATTLPMAGPPTALIVGDATGSLWAARPEVQEAEQQLRRAGWSTRVPDDSGSRPQVLAELALADLFHYAGHAAAAGEDDVALWPPYAGGAPGWPSYLQLQPPARLRVHEILMLPRAPRWVLLNGCRTGVLDVQHAGISLALAFLAAGSEQVLASPEDVDDRLVGEVGRRIYEGLGPGEPLDLVARLQAVLRERVEAGQPLGRVRVWVR